MRIIAIIFTALALTTPAKAEQMQLQSGMQHIIVKRPTAPEKPTLDTAKAAPDQDDETKALWTKYKALAAGTYAPQEAKAAPKPEKTEEKPTSSTGITGIIEQYRKNKQSQSQLKTLTITQPQTKTIPTP